MFVMTTKAIFQMRRKHIFRQNFRKTRFYIRSLVPAALFPSAEKTQSKSKYRRIAMVLLAILRERTYWLVTHRELPFICLLLHESAPFSRNFCEVSNSLARVDQLQSEQIFH